MYRHGLNPDSRLQTHQYKKKKKMPTKQWLTLNDIKRSPFIVFKCANNTVGNKKFFSFEIHAKVFTDEMI